MGKSRRRLTLSPITVLFIGGLPASGMAQEGATDRQTRVMTLPPIQVETLLPPELENVSGAAGRITAEEIETRRPYTVHELLRRLPGVNTVDDDGLSRRSGIGIHGGAPRRSRKVLLLEDGVPINASTYLDPSGHYTPPIERIESVEVLRRGTVVHGPLNNHGIVNFRNMRPTPESETVVGGQIGSNDSNRRHFSHRGTVDNVGVVFSYTGADADGVFDLERLRYDDFYGSVKLTGDRSDFSISGLYYRERSNYDETNLTQAQFDANPRCKSCLGTGFEFNTFNADYLRLALAHDFYLSDDITISSKIYGSQLFRPRFESRRGGPLVPGGSMRGRVRTYQTIGAESRVEFADVDMFGVTNNFQAGVRAEHQHFDNHNVSGQIGEILDMDNRGFARAVRGVNNFGDDGAVEVFDAYAYSIFVQDAVSFGDVIVTPGVRVEAYSQRKQTEFDGGGAIANPDQRDNRTLLLPGISLTYTGFNDTTLFGSVHRGYAPAIARNEDFPLDPEIGINSQIGFRTTALTGVTFEAAAFHNILDNTLIKLTFTDAAGNNIFINSGEGLVRGVDIFGRLDSQPFMDGPLNLFGEVAYSFTDARFVNGAIDGNRFPEIPRHLASFTAGVEHLVDGWDVSATLSHRSDFFTDVANTVQGNAAGDTGLVSGHYLLSARVNWDVPGTPVKLFLAGTNLTDRLYISDRADGIKPGLGRTVFGGLTVAIDDLLGIGY